MSSTSNTSLNVSIISLSSSKLIFSVESSWIPLAMANTAFSPYVFALTLSALFFILSSSYLFASAISTYDIYFLSLLYFNLSNPKAIPTKTKKKAKVNHASVKSTISGDVTSKQIYIQAYAKIEKIAVHEYTPKS